MSEALDELSRTAIALVLSDPLLGHLASALRRATGDGRWPLTLHGSVSGYSLVVSAKRFLALSSAERRVALEHELLHLAFRHPQRAHAFADPDRFGIAADLVVNQYLRQGPPLPEMVTIQHFSPALPPKLSVDAYYELLPSLGRGRAGARRCRSGMPLWARTCLGESAPSPSKEPSPNGWAHDAASTSSKIASALIDEILHRGWVRTHRACRSIGSYPGALLEALERFAFERSSLDWRTVLRRFAASSQRSRLQNTTRRPSRRYGTFPGIKLRRSQRIAVCVDTSGSITNEDLGRFFAEIDRIGRTGAALEVLEADVEVQARYPYEGTPPNKVHGRGGTSFDPALRAVRTSKPRFDACIYLTDGQAPAPIERPGAAMLWVLSPNAEVPPAILHFGRVLRMQ